MSSYYYCDCDKRWQDNETCPACHPDKFEAKNPDREAAIQTLIEAIQTYLTQDAIVNPDYDKYPDEEIDTQLSNALAMLRKANK